MRTYLKQSTEVENVLKKFNIKFKSDNLYGETPVFVTNDDVSTLEGRIPSNGDFLTILNAVFIGVYFGDYTYNGSLIEG